jgi:hypothetical protein
MRGGMNDLPFSQPWDIMPTLTTANFTLFYKVDRDFSG